MFRLRRDSTAPRRGICRGRIPSTSSRCRGGSFAVRRKRSALASSGCSRRAPDTSAATSCATFSLPATASAFSASSCGLPAARDAIGLRHVTEHKLLHHVVGNCIRFRRPFESILYLVQTRI